MNSAVTVQPLVVWTRVAFAGMVASVDGAHRDGIEQMRGFLFHREPLSFSQRGRRDE